MANISSPFGQNEWLVEEMYRKFRDDPSSVDPSWHEFLVDYSPEPTSQPAAEPTRVTSPLVAERAAAAAPDRVRNPRSAQAGGTCSPFFGLPAIRPTPAPNRRSGRRRFRQLRAQRRSCWPEPAPPARGAERLLGRRRSTRRQLLGDMPPRRPWHGPRCSVRAGSRAPVAWRGYPAESRAHPGTQVGCRRQPSAVVARPCALACRRPLGRGYGGCCAP